MVATNDMQHKDKIEAIRQKCIEANPSILDLDFGCVLIPKSKDFKEIYCSYDFGHAKGYADAAFTVLEYEESGQIGDTGDWSEAKLLVHTNVMMGSFTEELYGRHTDFSIEDDIEIIGRPIRLADVLLAIPLNFGYIVVDGFVENKKTYNRFWDLKNDSLEKQSPETVDFLYQLLGGNAE